MSFNNTVDIVSSLAKLGIEYSNQTPRQKEYEKTIVDLVKFGLESSAHMTGVPIHTLSFESIYTIKQLAQKHSLSKVVIFPVQDAGRYNVLYMKAYGDSSTAFMSELGIVGSNSHGSFTNDHFEEMEKNYGIILYEQGE